MTFAENPTGLPPNGVAKVLEFPCPRPDEDVFLFGPKPVLSETQQGIAQALQEAAFEALPPYEVEIVSRSTHKETEETKMGSRFQETVRFSDGAVRLLDRYIPKPKFFGIDNISPYPISATDALGAGPDGFSKKTAESFLELGYEVIWLHHQGRHSVLPTSLDRVKTMARFLSSKSVGKSAHHQHVLMDDLAPTSDGHMDEYVKIGDSRSSMEGEAEEATAPLYGHRILWGDYIATCLAHELESEERSEARKQQLPREGFALGRILGEKLLARDFAGIWEMSGTFDLHPLNIVHELAWLRPLIKTGDTGRHAQAVPLNALGVRTHLSGDLVSQYEDFDTIHSVRPGVHVQRQRAKKGRDLMHLDLIRAEVQEPRLERFKLLLQYAQSHGMSLTGLKLEDIVPNNQFAIAA